MKPIVSLARSTGTGSIPWREVQNSEGSRLPRGSGRQVLGSALHVHIKARFPDRRFLGTTPFFDDTCSVPADEPGADNSGCHWILATHTVHNHRNPQSERGRASPSRPRYAEM